VTRHPARPPRRRRRAVIAGAAAVAVTLLGACGSSSSTAAGGVASTGRSITLYSGQHEQTTQQLIVAFEKKTGIKVKVRYNDEDTFGNEIVAEGPHPEADIFYTENTPVLAFLEEKHLLASLPRATLSATPARYDDPAGEWVGVSARVSVLVYDPRLIRASDLPTSVLALADPRYKGKVAFAPGETDFQPIVTAVAKRYGDAAAVKWLKGLAANAGQSRRYGSNEALVDEINRGAAAFGLLNQYYWYRLGAEIGSSNVHSRIAFLAPHDPGYVVDVSGAAVLASSSHKADADRFVAFLVSAEGQRIIGDSLSYEYPIAAGVTTAEPEKPFGRLQPDDISPVALGDGSTAIALLKQAGLS
jgi:iron(III) transport system substrate-binding protein